MKTTHHFFGFYGNAVSPISSANLLMAEGKSILNSNKDNLSLYMQEIIIKNAIYKFKQVLEDKMTPDEMLSEAYLQLSKSYCKLDKLQNPETVRTIVEESNGLKNYGTLYDPDEEVGVITQHANMHEAIDALKKSIDIDINCFNRRKAINQDELLAKLYMLSDAYHFIGDASAEAEILEQADYTENLLAPFQNS